MNIKEILTKSIITPSKIPGIDYVINPYVGCIHGCGYCYAQFMKKFTHHDEAWGYFVDIKINAADVIPMKTEKYKNKIIQIGSVTDPYQPIEKKYQLMRKILPKLLPFHSKIRIVTKSDLIVRDIDLLKQLHDCAVLISLAFTDNPQLYGIEARTCSVEKRINALKQLKAAGIKTILFISPIFPELTDWRALVHLTKDFVDEFWFENLNFYSYIRQDVFQFLKKIDPALIKKYQDIYSKQSDYWQIEQEKIIDFCHETKVNTKFCFHFD